MPDASWRESRNKRVQVALISTLGYPLLATLGATYRFTIDGAEHLEAAQALGHPIHAFWHGRILPGTIFFKRRGIVVITSDNFDGEWIARIITKFGYGTARGSSSRGARKALLQLVRDVKHRPVAFTLDGPRGPAGVAQPGAAWLAKATGNPILPFHFEANRHWTVNSWDHAEIPKPCATIAVAFAAPLCVPSEADEAALADTSRRLEQALAGCAARCRAMISAV